MNRNRLKYTATLILTFSLLSAGQLHCNTIRPDSLKKSTDFSASVTVTNKGISLIPNLTLGKPAIIFEASAGNRLTFDPQLRFSLEGKPWTFLFWWRYKTVTGNKFNLTLGAHPALAFKSVTVQSNGNDIEIINVSRYLASEITPTFTITKNFSAGAYYLYSHGFDPYAVKNTHYVSIRGYFSSIRLTKKISARFSPQVYYLNLTGSNGYYFNTAISVSLSDFPFSLSSLASKALDTSIQGNKDLLWNISLSYNFRKTVTGK